MEPTNEQRADWANEAVRRFERVSREREREDVLSDLLADLMHWADEQGQDFDAELRRARGHYNAESYVSAGRS